MIKDWNLLPPDIFIKIRTAEEPAKTYSEIVHVVRGPHLSKLLDVCAVLISLNVSP